MQEAGHNLLVTMGLIYVGRKSSETVLTIKLSTVETTPSNASLRVKTSFLGLDGCPDVMSRGKGCHEVRKRKFAENNDWLEIGTRER